jgi:hypothetical protein
LIRSEHQVESLFFASLEKFSILKLRMAPHIGECAHLMAGKEAANANRNILIKEETQRRIRNAMARGISQNRFDTIRRQFQTVP